MKTKKVFTTVFITTAFLFLFFVALGSVSLAGFIGGTVSDSSGSLITGVSINVDVYTGDPCGNYQFVAGTSTDTGYYSVNGLPGGTFYVRTSHEITTYVDEWWTGGSPDPSDPDCSQAQSITQESNQGVFGINFWLETGADDELACDFGTAYGLYYYDQTGGWTQLNTADPGEMVSVDIDEDGQDELAVSFEDYGLYTYDETNGWTQINTVIPEGMIAFGGTKLACDFGTAYGLYTYDQTNGWIQLNTADPGLMLSVDVDNDGLDELAVGFAGYGLYTYDETNGWTQINTVVPEGMVAFGGTRLVCDFGTAYGLYTYDQTNGWTQLNTADPGLMLSVDVDNDGQDELAVSFDSYGLYTYDETNGWTQINTVVPEGMVAFGGTKLACDFGTAYGLYTYDQTSGWTQLNTADPGLMISVDVDKDGHDELAVSFTGYGLYTYDETNGWTQINTVIPEGIIATNLFK